jgi:hypothetical protein
MTRFAFRPTAGLSVLLHSIAIAHNGYKGIVELDANFFSSVDVPVVNGYECWCLNSAIFRAICMSCRSSSCCFVFQLTIPFTTLETRAPTPAEPRMSPRISGQVIASPRAGPRCRGGKLGGAAR